MHLFILALNLPKESSSQVLAELQQMVEVYPQLDRDTLWHYSQAETVFAAGIHQPNHAIAPRQYVSLSSEQVVFYDGCLFDRTGSFNAHHAQDLALHWQQMHEVLEGQFVAVKVTEKPLCIELMLDCLGMEQVYYFHQGDRWLISNNVRLIERLSKISAWDPLGVSMVLGIGWVGADRTLKQDIRVVPGGECWKWQHNFTEPSRIPYFTRSQLRHQRYRKLTHSQTQELAKEMVGNCRLLAENFGELRCPLTGGRDSRMLAALLIHGQINANYYTDGAIGSTDVEVSKRVAAALNLPYHNDHTINSDALEQWDFVSWRLVEQNDGMVSLWQIIDILRQPWQIDHLGVCLTGFGGEIARGYYRDTPMGEQLFASPNQRDWVQRILPAKMIRNSGQLVKQETKVMAQTYLQQLMEQFLDEGFAPIDVPHLLFTYERVRRWAGSNARKTLPQQDVFSPYCTRAFVETAFALPPDYRYCETLHYELTKFLVPQLHSLPYDAPWLWQPPITYLMQRRLDAVVRKVNRLFPHLLKHYQSQQSYHSQQSSSIPAFTKSAWLEAKLLPLRELCLDQKNSPLWDFVNRSEFERIMSSAAEPTERSKYLTNLYTIITLFYYQILTDKSKV